MARVSELNSKGKKPQVSQGKRAPFKLASRLLERLTARSEVKRSALGDEAALPSGPAERRKFLKIIGGATGAAVLFGSSLLKADETKIARAETKRKVEYEAFSDPGVLEPFFEEASSKMVQLNPNGVTIIGQFEVRVTDSDEYGVDFTVKDPSGKETVIPFSSPLSGINAFNLDFGSSHPYFKGNVVILASDNMVCFMHKCPRGYELRAVNLMMGKMRKGPIRTGIGMDGQTLLVMGSPETLKQGDVVYQVQFEATGRSGGSFYKYDTGVPEGTMLASI